MKHASHLLMRTGKCWRIISAALHISGRAYFLALSVPSHSSSISPNSQKFSGLVLTCASLQCTQMRIWEFAKRKVSTLTEGNLAPEHSCTTICSFLQQHPELWSVTNANACHATVECWAVQGTQHAWSPVHLKMAGAQE